MNRENIIQMAKDAGFYIHNNEIYSMSTQSDQELTEWIERFATLVWKDGFNRGFKSGHDWADKMNESKEKNS